jgi:hypothetical protein
VQCSDYGGDGHVCEAAYGCHYYPVGVGLPGLHGVEYESSDSGIDDAAGRRLTIKKLFQRLPGTAGGAADDEVIGSCNIKGHRAGCQCGEEQEDLTADTLDSLLSAVDEAQSRNLDLGSTQGRGVLQAPISSVRSAAKSVIGIVSDDIRAARQTVVAVGGGISRLAQGVGRTANASRTSIVAGTSPLPLLLLAHVSGPYIQLQKHPPFHF